MNDNKIVNTADSNSMTQPDDSSANTLDVQEPTDNISIVGTENVDVPPFPQIVSAGESIKTEPIEEPPLQIPNNENKKEEIQDFQVLGKVEDVQPRFPPEAITPTVPIMAKAEKFNSTKSPSTKKPRVFVATILGLFLLVGGVAAGVILVQRQQEVRERASEEGLESNLAGPGEACAGPEAIYCIDGYVCIYTNGSTQSSSPSDTGICQLPIKVVAIPTIQCIDIKTYQQIEVSAPGGGGFETRWVKLSTTELSGLSINDTVYFTVTGKSKDITKFTKARFKINDGEYQEVPSSTNTKPRAETDPVDQIEIFFEYKIPTETTNFKVEADVYHEEVGWVGVNE